MREVQPVALLLEQVGEPLPAVGRLQCDLQLAAKLGQDRLQRLWVVCDSAREQLRPLLVESSDLRALAVQVDTDVDHLGWASFQVPTSLISLGIAPREDGAQQARFFMASSGRSWLLVGSFRWVRVIDGAKSRPLGLTESAALLCPSRAMKMRAPVSRPHPLSLVRWIASR